MPWFSFHGGHSGQYCRHAKGQLADVVARAAEVGFTTYGLSEHCARDRVEDLFPGEEDLGPAGLAELFAAYADEAARLRDEYAGRLELLVGFETEALPPHGWANAMRAVRDALPACDYIIGSVHHVGGICIDFDAPLQERAAEVAGGREALEIAYFGLVEQVADELRPEVLGHVDLIRKFSGDGASLTPGGQLACERALEAALEAGCALDVNAAPARRGLGPVYPLPWILERARKMAIPVTLGDDSHGPHDVGVGLDACMAAIAAAGYREVHYLTRRDGTVTLAAAPIDQVRPVAPAQAPAAR